MGHKWLKIESVAMREESNKVLESKQQYLSQMYRKELHSGYSKKLQKQKEQVQQKKVTCNLLIS